MRKGRGSTVSPDALRAARERAGLTQHQLARLVDVAGGERVSRWELGTSEPRPDILVRLARVLGLPALHLIDTDGTAPDLRALRYAAGLSATEVAATAHVSKPTYERWEAGRWTRIPSPANLDDLGSALGVTASDILEAFGQARARADLAGGKAIERSSPNSGADRHDADTGHPRLLAEPGADDDPSGASESPGPSDAPSTTRGTSAPAREGGIGNTASPDA